MWRDYVYELGAHMRTATSLSMQGFLRRWRCPSESYFSDCLIKRMSTKDEEPHAQLGRQELNEEAPGAPYLPYDAEGILAQAPNRRGRTLCKEKCGAPARSEYKQTPLGR